MTFEPLREGLADFVTVTDAEIAEAIRILLRTTHNLAEGAGAAGSPACCGSRERLAGKRVGIIVSGGNIDARDAPAGRQRGDLRSVNRTRFASSIERRGPA